MIQDHLPFRCRPNRDVVDRPAFDQGWFVITSTLVAPVRISNFWLQVSRRRGFTSRGCGAVAGRRVSYCFSILISESADFVEGIVGYVNPSWPRLDS